MSRILHTAFTSPLTLVFLVSSSSSSSFTVTLGSLAADEDDEELFLFVCCSCHQPLHSIASVWTSEMGDEQHTDLRTLPLILFILRLIIKLIVSNLQLILLLLHE